MGMRPKDFWAMSIIEWRAVLSGFRERMGAQPPGADGLNGAELKSLMRRFPDEGA